MKSCQLHTRRCVLIYSALANKRTLVVLIFERPKLNNYFVSQTIVTSCMRHKIYKIFSSKRMSFNYLVESRNSVSALN